MKIFRMIAVCFSLVIASYQVQASDYRSALNAADQPSPCRNLASCLANYDQFVPYGDIHDYPAYVYSEGRNRRFPKTIPALGKRMFIFSPRHKRWAAYDESGQRVGHGRANGGSSYCADLNKPCRTPRGLFRVYSKGSPGCKSNKFPLGRGGAPMPYCMFFHGGYAIHGSPWISNVNGSHGCIRVTNTAAAWLSNNFMQHGTRVLVLPY